MLFIFFLFQLIRRAPRSVSGDRSGEAKLTGVDTREIFMARLRVDAHRDVGIKHVWRQH